MNSISGKILSPGLQKCKYQNGIPQYNFKIEKLPDIHIAHCHIQYAYLFKSIHIYSILYEGRRAGAKKTKKTYGLASDEIEWHLCTIPALQPVDSAFEVKLL